MDTISGSEGLGSCGRCAGSGFSGYVVSIQHLLFSSFVSMTERFRPVCLVWLVHFGKLEVVLSFLSSFFLLLFFFPYLFVIGLFMSSHSSRVSIGNH